MFSRFAVPFTGGFEDLEESLTLRLAYPSSAREHCTKPQAMRTKMSAVELLRLD